MTHITIKIYDDEKKPIEVKDENGCEIEGMALEGNPTGLPIRPKCTIKALEPIIVYWCNPTCVWIKGVLYGPGC